MGTPTAGRAFLCRKGHLYRCFDEDLCWNEELEEEFRRAEKEGCPCGEKAVFLLRTYGDRATRSFSLGDGTIGALRCVGTAPLRFRIRDAVDAQGRSIEAYRVVHCEVHNVAEVLVGPSGTNLLRNLLLPR